MTDKYLYPEKEKDAPKVMKVTFDNAVKGLQHLHEYGHKTFLKGSHYWYNGMYGVVGHGADTEPFYVYSGACHASFPNLIGGCVGPALGFSITHNPACNIADKAVIDVNRPAVSKDDVVLFFDWLLNRSPWHKAIHPRQTMELALELGWIVDLRYPAPYLQGINICSRHVREHKDVIRNFAMMKRAGCENETLAYFLAVCHREKHDPRTKTFYLNVEQRGHSPCSIDFGLTSVINFIKHKWSGELRSARKMPKYAGVFAGWGHNGEDFIKNKETGLNGWGETLFNKFIPKFKKNWNYKKEEEKSTTKVARPDPFGRGLANSTRSTYERTLSFEFKTQEECWVFLYRAAEAFLLEKGKFDVTNF